MKNRRWLGLAVPCALALLLLAGPAAAATPFPDVPSDHPYYQAITGMADRGIIGGYGNGNFGPSDLVLRQQFAKMIVLTMGLTVTGSEACPFTDVATQLGNDPFYPSKYVAVCAANKITMGKTATTFDPNNHITRAQVLTMIVRAADQLAPGTLQPIPSADWTGELPSYNDPTHGANIKKAEYNGLLAGIIGPTGNLSYWHTVEDATRGEVAQILWNLIVLMEPQATWTDLAPANSPLARGGHALVYLPGPDKIMMFAGVAQTSPGSIAFSSQCMAYDPALNQWSTLGTGTTPSGRYGHAMVYCPSTGKVILFGGGTGDYVNDTWAFDPGAGTWTELHPSGSLPPARAYGMMVYVPSTGKVILFGGVGTTSQNQAYMNDTWAYDPVANTWTDLNPLGPPPARSDGTFAYDSVGGKAILFGGNGGGTVRNDTWSYDPAANSWTNLSPSGSLPAARLGAASAFDPVNRRIVVFGGYAAGATVLDDTWAYSPSTNAWSELSASNPPAARYHGAMVYEPTTGRMILYGGIGADNNTRLGDTWAFTP